MSEAGTASHPDIDDITVVIPAAGRVDESVLALANVASPAMIPVAGRPVIYWTLTYLRDLGLKRFIVAVPEPGMFVEDFIECTFGADVQVDFITPSRDGGVGLTVKELLAEVKTSASLVVLGDTYFTFEDVALLTSGQPFVLACPVEDSRRWCIAEVDAHNALTALYDKEVDRPGPLNALIGVYGFSDTAAALASAEACSGTSIEMSAILNGVNASTPILVAKAGDWLDCGNADRQASSHRTLLQKREFNELAIDPVFGTITKRSRHVDKFINEINYLRLLPPNLQVLFPRVLGFSTDWDDPWVELEYYGYPTLSETFLFENVDPSIWEQIFAHLFEIITQGFMKHRRPLPEATLEDMYLTKTHQRLQFCKGSEDIQRLIRVEGDIEINGRPYANLPMLWNRVIDIVDGWSEGTEGTIIHGDLCLSNILYDLRSRICKLIDPRGSFGEVGTFGDPLYDVAKLYHSIYGLYDFIVTDVFIVSVDGNRIDLKMQQRPNHRAILERFDAVFFPTFDRKAVLLRTGLLFASMPALHYDSPRRQIAMYARALQLIDEALAP